MTELRHGRLALWMETVREGEGPALLVLHELGGSGSQAVASLGAALDAWPGPVYSVDFCGHGRSGRLRGGAYTPELLAADADAAIAAIDRPLWLVGTGIGAYVCLLLAGSRPDVVGGAVLWPGRGLAGGGAEPDFSKSEPPSRVGVELPEVSPQLQAEPSTDPRVALLLESDIRPLDYVDTFAAAARQILLAEDARVMPRWWTGLRSAACARVVDGEDPRSVLSLAARLAAVPEEPGSPRGSGPGSRSRSDSG